MNGWQLLTVGCVLLGTACADRGGPLQLPVVIPDTSPFQYPVGLWDQGIEGETLLMVHVTAGGGVDSTYVLQASGHVEFDSAAVAGARRLQFSPARRGRRPVALWTRLPVRFQRDTIQLGEPVGGGHE